MIWVFRTEKEHKSVVSVMSWKLSFFCLKLCGNGRTSCRRWLYGHLRRLVPKSHSCRQHQGSFSLAGQREDIYHWQSHLLPQGHLDWAGGWASVIRSADSLPDRRSHRRNTRRNSRARVGLTVQIWPGEGSEVPKEAFHRRLCLAPGSVNLGWTEWAVGK